ncbi:hypothetical protein [Arenimonas daejeonensis]|uniref:hypothetical protein n=1 Tax=Arenimonas daejeonensis TaxID=370777 RepID=UPI0011BF477A|nr:hypothetical protein [Arenimonas daejeonensis]
MSEVFLNTLGMANALGRDVDGVAANLFASDAPRGVAPTDTVTSNRRLALGLVPGPMPGLGQWPLRCRDATMR